MMKYDFCILGAGIAGLSLADALQAHSRSVLVLEKDDIAAGASGTPAGLVNPATGRKGKKVWKAEQCYCAIRNNLKKIQSTTTHSIFQTNGLLRPALTSKMARKMHQQFKHTDWPKGWCVWQHETEIKARHAGINCVGGGLWLPIGLTVDVPAYLNAYAGYLQAKGVVIHTNTNVKYERNSDAWLIRTGETSCHTQELVFAIGYGTVRHPCWNYLPLEGVKGQVAKFKADKKLTSFSYSISSMGYIARLGEANTFIQGSTYGHNFDNLRPDRKGLKYLRGRTRKVLPELGRHATLINQWAGVRVNTPNRKPVLGRHPEIPNLHVFAGLGSKGLMYGKFLAEHYADHLQNGTSLFPQISIERFKGQFRDS